MASFRNRIVEYGIKPADQFTANPRNPRIHPQFQREVMQAALEGIGWIAPVIENRRTGYLVDGHERVMQALLNNTDVPYVVVDLDEAEEAEALATFDPITGLAQYDRDNLESLLQDVSTDSPAIQQMLADLMGNKALPFVSEAEIDIQGIDRHDVPDAVWPTDNEWGVPLLDLNMQADALDLPVTRWGKDTRKQVMGGTYHFYTEDYKFEALWTDPSPIVNSRCINVIEPNYSTSMNMPRAVALWGVYRKRWLSRWWQSRDVRIFVDLNIETPFDEIALLGVPRGWKSYANRGYGRDMKHLDIAYQWAIEHAGTSSVLYVVYGGGKTVADYCRQKGWLYVMEDAHATEGRDY